MKKYTTTAIVLKNISYGDSNKIYTLLSKEEGKISVAARGVRKITSKRAGSLDSISLVKAEISEDVKGYKSVLEVKCLNSYSKIKEDFMCSMGVIYLAELLDKFIEPDHKNEELFALFYHTLGLLNKGELNRDLVIAFFEIFFCKSMGFEMTLDKCVYCAKPYSPSWLKVYYDADLSGFICDSCRKQKRTESEVTFEVAETLHLLSLGKVQSGCSKISDDNIVKLCEFVKSHLDKIVSQEDKRIKSRSLV